MEKRLLSKPVDILGTTVSNCEDAAYRVRQQVITRFDIKGAHLVRFLRGVNSQGDVRLAESALKAWLQERARSRIIDAEFSRCPNTKQHCKR